MKPLFIRHVRRGSSANWWHFKAAPANFVGVIVLLFLIAAIIFPALWLQRHFGLDSLIGVIVFVSTLLGGLGILMFVVAKLSVTAEEYAKEHKHNA